MVAGVAATAAGVAVIVAGVEVVLDLLLHHRLHELSARRLFLITRVVARHASCIPYEPHLHFNAREISHVLKFRIF